MALSYAEAKEQFQGIGYHATTYKAGTGISANTNGKVVCLSGNGEVTLGSDTNPIIGVQLKYEQDGYVTVQDAGYAVDVPMHDDEITAAGQWGESNGSGAVAKTTTFKGVTAIAFDATADLCIIKIG